MAPRSSLFKRPTRRSTRTELKLLHIVLLNASHTSGQVTEMDEYIPLEAWKHQTAPIPFTRNHNKDTSNAVMGEFKIDEGHIPGMVKESTVWDVYNNEARKVDNELVKDWTASLNFLLVFVSPLPLVIMVD
jgi:Family of unknown function (DUF6535)